MNTKKELIQRLATNRGISKKDAEIYVNSVLYAMTGCIADGGLKITGLFSIVPAVRKARDYKNPKTNEVVHKEDCKTLKFKIGNELNKLISGIE